MQIQIQIIIRTESSFNPQASRRSPFQKDSPKDQGGNAYLGQKDSMEITHCKSQSRGVTLFPRWCLVGTSLTPHMQSYSSLTC